MDSGEADIARVHAAYHEAGHVIADLVFGFRFTFVTISPDEPGEYEGAVSGSNRGRARDLAVVQLAGIMASARMAGSDPWERPPRFDDDSADIATAGDFIENWVAFLAKQYGESSYREQVWRESEEKTRLLVNANWEAIEIIAETLLDRERLSCDEVIRILKERCPAFRAAEESLSQKNLE